MTNISAAELARVPAIAEQVYELLVDRADTHGLLPTLVETKSLTRASESAVWAAYRYLEENRLVARHGTGPGRTIKLLATGQVVRATPRKSPWDRPVADQTVAWLRLCSAKGVQFEDAPKASAPVRRIRSSAIYPQTFGGVAVY